MKAGVRPGEHRVSTVAYGGLQGCRSGAFQGAYIITSYIQEHHPSARAFSLAIRAGGIGKDVIDRVCHRHHLVRLPTCPRLPNSRPAAPNAQLCAICSGHFFFHLLLVIPSYLVIAKKLDGFALLRGGRARASSATRIDNSRFDGESAAGPRPAVIVSLELIGRGGKRVRIISERPSTYVAQPQVAKVSSEKMSKRKESPSPK